MATLSLLGLMSQGDDVLELLQVPDGIDKDVLCNNLMLEVAEFEILYTNPAFMRMAVGQWSAKELSVWTRMWNAMKLEYNPIENYDRYESWEDSNRVLRSSSGSTSSSTKTTGESNDNVTETGSILDQKGVAAYNDSAFSPTEKVDRDDSRTRTGETNDSTTTMGSVSQNDNANETSQNTRTGRAHGNIGVTTSQEMLKQELEIAKVNVMDYIIQQFKRRFCLLVY